MCESCSSFRAGLFTHGLLHKTGVDGLYARSGLYEDVQNAFERFVTSFARNEQAEVVRFPPGMNRALFEKSGYLKGFPQLVGTVHAFTGGEREHAILLGHLEAGDDWTEGQKATDIVLAPAACYPLYPLVAARGRLPETGGLYNIESWCFRREPSEDPARQQMFRMREYVRLGTPEQVTAFRGTWLERGREIMSRLQLPYEIDVANDPFFGRGGKMMANNQRDQKLKFELLVPIESDEKKTACLSFNYHQDHFGTLWGIETATGETSHSGCVGFGLDRVALALLKHHGYEVAGWPASVREALWG